MHLVSCRHTISGCRSDNHFTILSIRCLMELTFQLAMRMGRRSPVFKGRGRMAPFEPIRKLGSRLSPHGAEDAEGESLVLEITPGAMVQHSAEPSAARHQSSEREPEAGDVALAENSI